uniref:Secreted protein n=1 Tax=Haemonchus placei TaxID=6290 RepID=A0A0N4WGI7_HAEPC
LFIRRCRFRCILSFRFDLGASLFLIGMLLTITSSPSTSSSIIMTVIETSTPSSTTLNMSASFV